MSRAFAAGEVSVNAIAGTHSILMGFDIADKERDGLLGFAIFRKDLDTGEARWLRGMKHFPDMQSDALTETIRSVEAPFQTFQWADYAVLPGRSYRYTVFPMRGCHKAMEQGPGTSVTITSETNYDAAHKVYFNRGAIASQAYARRFLNQPPEDAGPSAFAWLGRDLLPGFLEFVRRAGSGDRLRAAIFETRFDPALKALKDAAARGAKVTLIYGAATGTDTTKENEKALTAAGMNAIVHPRSASKLMHHKFITLEKSDQPVAVWTGSTNLSTNAFYGQLNVGHVVEDENVTAAFIELWDTLYDDPIRDDTKDVIEKINPVPPNNSLPALFAIFSPHRGHGVFNWYLKQAHNANKALFVTCPFGIVRAFRPTFLRKDSIYKQVLLEKFVNGGTKASRAQAKKEIQQARNLPNVTMAKGGRIFTRKVDGWLLESHGIGTWVNWVHTKFMLIDPLSAAPITIAGSANWSTNSVDTNDENMLFINGDKRVADIYLTEFARVFSHHAFRESLGWHFQRDGTEKNWKPRDLATSSAWTDDYFDRAKDRFHRRCYFGKQAD